jgi:translation initiation factor IF-3
MDYGKYHYKEQKATRDARKNQKSIELKEIKFRPKVDAHDYNFKKQAIERILSEGDKVKATMFFRGREMAHPDFGRRILDRLVDDLEGIATAEGRPAMMGNQMHIILSGVASAKTGVASAKKIQSA